MDRSQVVAREAGQISVLGNELEQLTAGLRESVALRPGKWPRRLDEDMVGAGRIDAGQRQSLELRFLLERIDRDSVDRDGGHGCDSGSRCPRIT